MITDFNGEIIFFQYTILNTTWHTCSFSKNDCWVNVILLSSQIFQVTSYLPGDNHNDPTASFLTEISHMFINLVVKLFHIWCLFHLNLGEQFSLSWNVRLYYVANWLGDTRLQRSGMWSSSSGRTLGYGSFQVTRKSLVSCPG